MIHFKPTRSWASTRKSNLEGVSSPHELFVGSEKGYKPLQRMPEAHGLYAVYGGAPHRKRGVSDYAMPMDPHCSYSELLKSTNGSLALRRTTSEKQALIRTCTTNPVIRLLLFYLAVFVTNLWGMVNLAIWPPYRMWTPKVLYKRLPLDLFCFQLAAPEYGLAGGCPTRG